MIPMPPTIDVCSTQWRNIQLDFAALAAGGLVKPGAEFEKAHTFPASQPFFDPLDANQLFASFAPDPATEFWLYVHVPFCNYRCAFCFYYSLGATSANRWGKQFMDSLRHEMHSACQRLGRLRLTFHDLYIGGGTPTALDMPDLAEFLDLVGSFSRPGHDPLVSLEASPESVTLEKAALLKERGVDRISIGFQSMDQERLDFSRRRHSVEQAFRAYEIFREAGFRHINVDLIYGFPGQAVSDWEKELSFVLNQVEPDSFTFYYLRYVPGTPFERSIPEASRATWSTLVSMRQMYMDVLESHGYEMCRPHFYRKPEASVRRYRGAPTMDHSNFGTQVGFGPSAYSHLGSTVGRSNKTLPGWMGRVAHNGFGTVEGRVLSLNDRLTRTIVKTLCQRAFILEEAFQNEFGARIDFYFGPKLAALIDLGLVERVLGGYELTRKGILVDEEVSYFLYRERFQIA